MAGWHHRCNGHEPGQTPIVGDREAWHAAVHRLAELDTTGQLDNNTIDKMINVLFIRNSELNF